MDDYVPKRGWPIRSCDLLLRSVLCEREVADSAWDCWSREVGLERASWSEVRLLASLGSNGRLPTGVEASRIQGIRRFVWAKTQMQLVPALDGLGVLAQHGVDVLLIKGAARLASSPTCARLVRDVDVLVPVAQAERALELLLHAGWKLSEWQRRLRETNPITAHHAWSVSSGAAEIDLHHFSSFLNRADGDDAGLWARSRRVEWRGFRVRVPSASDGLLLAILHGVRWSKERAADWVLDAVSYLQDGVRWEVVEREAKERQVESIVHSGLTYLRERIGCAIPCDTVAALTTSDPKAAERLFVYTYIAHMPVM